jgi:hypothetical protein
MTNEQYLVVSYFCVAVISVVIGLAAYFWMRAPFHRLASALPWKALGELLSRLFPVGIVLPAVLGFVSVSYRGCNTQEYEKIIVNRSYLISKSQDQISASLGHVMWAVFAWCVLVSILLAVKRRFDHRAASSPDENEQK